MNLLFKIKIVFALLIGLLLMPTCINAQQLNLKLDYSTFFGRNCFVQTDKDGNIYCMGETSSSAFPTTQGSFGRTLGGSSDIYVSKFSPNGKNLIYSTYLGGSGEEFHSWFMKIDNEGCVYIAGTTTSNDFPITTNAIGKTYKGNQDLFIVKLNATGTSLLYSTYLGGSGAEFPSSIEIDKQGNIYVSGYTQSIDFPVSDNAFDKTRNGDNTTWSTFITKINPSLDHPVYSTYINGIWGGYLAVDSDGNCVIATRVQTGANPPTTQGVLGKSYNGGDADVYIAKLNAVGSNLMFATFLGGNSYDSPGTILIDNKNNIIIYGETWSSNYPTTAGVYSRTNNDYSHRLFLTKIDSAATHVICSSYFLPNFTGYLENMAIDIDNNLYATIIASSAGLPSTQDSYVKTYRGTGSDGYLFVVNPEMTKILYGTYVGTSTGYGDAFVAAGSTGSIYLSGDTSPDFQTTTDAFRREPQEGGFIMKFTREIKSSVNKDESFPSGFKLNQNYPNPFNPCTVISYRLAASGNVKLKIYDTLGRKVKTLVDSFQSAGEHSITWNASDNATNAVSSGIYFYCLEAGSYSETRKLTLLK